MKEFLIAHLDHNVDAILVEELLQGKAYNRVVLDCKNQERGLKERRARDIREEELEIRKNDGHKLHGVDVGSTTNKKKIKIKKKIKNKKRKRR